MDFYVILGIDRSASQNEVRRAYRRLSRRYHPGINPGDLEAAAFFEQATQAFETLIDPDRRRRYDRGEQAAPPAVPEPFAFEGFDFSGRRERRRESTFAELFAEALGPRDRRAPDRRAETGADLHVEITVGFEDAMNGATRFVTVTRLEPCARCQGSGLLTTGASQCPHCHGAGRTESTRGHMIFSRPCVHCGGTGEQQSQRCHVCHGETVTPRTETVTATLPPGVAGGTRLRIPGKGHAGRQGGPAGDLYVTVNVEPHPLYQRVGDDLLVVVPLAIHEAALGAKIEIPTFEGPARMRVPAGTQSGQRFRLRGRGAPSDRNGGRGDLIVETRLVLPDLLDERSKELLREFGRIHTDNVRKGLGV
jgi:molecular chaperone DnaJ